MMKSFNEHPKPGNPGEDIESIEMFDPSQLDLKLFTHIGDTPFTPVDDEVIESDWDETEQ